MKTNNLIPFLNIAEGKSKKSGIDFKNEDSAEAADIYIYDNIGYFGVNANDVLEQIRNIKSPVINVHINSPGGSVFEGLAIYNTLAKHKSKVVVNVDGFAASISSIIALAGDEVNIADNGMFMIHNPSMMTFGESKDLRKDADILDQIKESLISTYESGTNMSRDSIVEAMDNETWYTADESVKNGLATAKVNNKKVAACFEIKQFDKAPEQAQNLLTEMKSNATPKTLSVEEIEAYAERMAKVAHLN